MAWLACRAPERIHQEPIGRAADIHAAAVAPWEALAGARRPRNGGEAEQNMDVPSRGHPCPS
ncbi:Hypothetical protein A7982_04693 [Minicystis rosea]|nr:Hypothetical protein A7982_04693 [Minicystis rosea]